MKKGNLVGFVTEVVCWRAVDISVNATKARNSGTPEDEIASAINEALAVVLSVQFSASMRICVMRIRCVVPSGDARERAIQDQVDSILCSCLNMVNGERTSTVKSIALDKNDGSNWEDLR